MSLVVAGSEEGQVMINNRPVCDQGWDDVDAGVFCRMLGFGSGEATTGSGKASSDHFIEESLD